MARGDVEKALYGALVGRRREVVMALHRDGAATLARLREATGLSSSSLLFEISALESLGVLRREGNVVKLTPLGERVASALSSMQPLRGLDFLKLMGLRPLVVWLAFSPHLRPLAVLLVATWTAALVVSHLDGVHISLVGLIYVGRYLPMSWGGYLGLPISAASVASILALSYLASGRALTPSRAVAGLIPMLLYPCVHLTLVDLYRATGAAFAVVLSQVLLPVAMLITAATFASVYSLEVGTPYEAALARSLMVFFVVPALAYLQANMALT